MSREQSYWTRAEGGCIAGVMEALSIFSFYVFICCTTVLLSILFISISVLSFSGLLHASNTVKLASVQLLRSRSERNVFGTTLSNLKV
jgi:hypothetical protein